MESPRICEKIEKKKKKRNKLYMALMFYIANPCKTGFYMLCIL
jgi:hypothetical protein